MSSTRPILAPAYRQILADYARSHPLVALDYDGTLAPIAPSPDVARMLPSTRRLLAEVARCYPTIVISGRAHADLTARLESLPLWHVVGNHGLELSPASKPATAVVNEWLRVLRRELPPPLGILIEDKAHSLTLHFRQAPNRDEAIAAIEAALEKLSDVIIIGGKEAVNLLPPGGGNKGTALQHVMTTLGCRRAIYVGDDETDEDAFRVAHSRPLLTIRVGPSSTSLASYHLERQDDIDTLLEALASFAEGRQATG